jgi:hypothetical protein
VIAGDQHAVLQEADVPIGVAGELDDAPAGDLVALTEEASVRDEVDEPAVCAADLEQFRRLLGRDALPGEPRGQLRNPGVAAPDLLALVVVERPL